MWVKYLLSFISELEDITSEEISEENRKEETIELIYNLVWEKRKEENKDWRAADNKSFKILSASGVIILLQLFLMKNLYANNFSNQSAVITLLVLGILSLILSILLGFSTVFPKKVVTVEAEKLVDNYYNAEERDYLKTISKSLAEDISKMVDKNQKKTIRIKYQIFSMVTGLILTFIAILISL